MHATLKACALVAVTSMLVSASADDVEWPIGFDSALSAKIEMMKPSGSQHGESATVSWFDSVMHADGYASLAELRNFPRPGFVLTFR